MNNRYENWTHSRIDLLKKNELFREKLVPDIQSGNVFPAIRGRKIDFYYYGQKLFSYGLNGKFRANIAYLFALENHMTSEIEEDKLNDIKLVTKFCAGYVQIKKNMEYRTRPESKNLSRLYRNHAWTKPTTDAEEKVYRVIDIELSLTRSENDSELDEKSKTDRIDLVILSSSGDLNFFEAKMKDNAEIRKTKSTEPPVVNQIKRYNDQLNKREKELISNYSSFVQVMNHLLDTDIPQPERTIHPVKLLVFGMQRGEKLSNLEGINVHTVGNPANVRQGTLANWCG